MLNLGITELLVVAGLALIVVGPERLPTVFRFMGKQYGKAVRASNDLKRAFMLEADRQDTDRRVAMLRERREIARQRLEKDEHRSNVDSEVTDGPAISPGLDGPTPIPTRPPTQGDPPSVQPEARSAQTHLPDTEVQGDEIE